MAQPNGHPLSADPNINTSTAPPPSTSDSFATTDPNHLSISLDQADSQFGDATFDSTSFGTTDFGSFDPSNSFSQQAGGVVDPSLAFNAQQSQQQFLSGDADFSLFPAGANQTDFNTPLFENNALSPGDMNAMASPSSHHTASPPGLLQPDGSIGSAQHSPSFNQQQFPHNVGQHSRNVSLGPEAALLPGQHDWSLPQFQIHRRSPSEFSDVSSAAPSPNLISSDNFDADISGHSPLQRPSDGSLYQEVIGISNFTIADAQANIAHGRSPSHSPAISPRIPPANMPDVNQQFGLASGYMTTPAYPTVQGPLDDYSMQAQMAPSINIDYAPTNARQGPFESNKSPMNQDSLAPPDRGRVKSRPRSVTDPFQQGASVARSHSSGSGAQTLGADLGARQDTSRSLSPLDRRSASTSSRNRRQSTSAVPNNVIALRLADPEYQGQEAGSAKRVQKHPATFQCTLCPKRFTRAYNLRSHLRTHTDERPFVCTVCGKAFARQHDRKRHESLHSGEKKFVCKGDLKAGGQWGCGRRFARADALGRHFRSEAGRICIKPLLDEEMIERQRTWQEQNVQQNLATQQQPQMDAGYPMDASGNMVFPAALLAQYPALAQMNWGADMGGNNSGLEDELSGRSSFDASDYDELEDGYVSASGSGIGQFGEVGF